MKLFVSTENRITTDRNGENVPHLEIKEVVLVHCNIFNIDYQQDSRVYVCFSSKSYLFKNIQLRIWWNYSMVY